MRIDPEHPCPRCGDLTTSRYTVCEACDQASRAQAWHGVRPGLRANELPWYLKLLSGLLSAALAFTLLFAVANNPGPQDYQAWYQFQLAQSVAQTAREGSFRSAAEATLGAVLSASAAPIATSRANFLLFSVYTTEYPGQEPLRVLAFSGRFYPLVVPRGQ